MQNLISFAWNSVAVKASEVMALMRKHRSDGVAILFHYGDALYRTGVDPKNVREPFYLDAETYPSMFAFSSAASVEGGFLLPDLQEPLHVLAVNDSDPAPYFS